MSSLKRSYWRLMVSLQTVNWSNDFVRKLLTWSILGHPAALVMPLNGVNHLGQISATWQPTKDMQPSPTHKANCSAGRQSKRVEFWLAVMVSGLATKMMVTRGSRHKCVNKANSLGQYTTSKYTQSPWLKRNMLKCPIWGRSNGRTLSKV